ncbi:transposable element Tc1 transposase [Trichonephila clavipes]|nr:transposable element Tc1 transposase [Trichonephila clavipes]
MAVNDSTASSRQFAARRCTATGVLLSASSIRQRLLHHGLRAKVPLYRILFTSNHRRLHESRFNLWDQDGRICVRCYTADKRCLPECVIEQQNGLTPGVVVWGAISYHGRSNLQRIEGNLNSNTYVREVLQPEVVPFLEGIPGAIFQLDNARPHVAKTVRDFCSAQHMQLLLWPAYSLDMWPIEHVWVWLVGISLVIHVLQLQKTNFCCAYKQYGILFHKQTFKICSNPCYVV